MSKFYHEGSRKLQSQFDTQRMADRLVEAIVVNQISPEDKVFIEEQNMFFFATVDLEGRPSCSYKGGSVGLVKVLDESTVAFPLYDGSGMYLSAGNVLVADFLSSVLNNGQLIDVSALKRSTAKSTKARTFAAAFRPS